VDGEAFASQFPVLNPKRCLTSKAVFYRRLASRTKLQLLYNVLIIFLVITLLGVVLSIVFACFPVQRKYTLDPAGMPAR
jgi:hypothetical protein